MRALGVLTIVLAAHGIARAGDEDPTKADQLFAEAQALRDQGKTAEACAKFDEALSYNPNAVGTLLNVGLCNEQSGKYATAARYYTQARDLAREHNLEEHLHAAEARLAATTPLVSHLAIAFAERAPEMKLVVDDAIVPLDRSEDVVVDPGSHHVVVTAPGRVPYETTVEVEQSKARAVAVPALGYPVTVKRGRVTVGKILTASGGAFLVTGISLGLYARSKYNGQLGGNCTDTDPPKCNAEGYRITNDARTFGTFGTWIGVAGVAVLGAGAYLWFFAPNATTERNVAVVPTLTPESAGLSALGRF
ncbi:MAG TPA: tetratricopeptide repeat protein [Kofleriaceae bacterium]|nr:tetratricopeptide repeat protein [Kofleriaceae bacterium]